MDINPTVSKISQQQHTGAQTICIRTQTQALKTQTQEWHKISNQEAISKHSQGKDIV